MKNRNLEFEKSLSGKRILITGHTGFTGGWAYLWLEKIGAKLLGFSLPADTKPSLFEELDKDGPIPTEYGDIRNYKEFLNIVQTFKPEIILHLAAQTLVRRSYLEPLKTISVNALGTANVLEVARNVNSVKAVLCVTTDKVYQNHELWPYRETDSLGGKDPYSASKAAAEMIAKSYSDSFGNYNNKALCIATARGGNIIGGGDWAQDRLIPDFVRAVTNKGNLTIRFPNATRPWQHVLALVNGYLILMAGMISKDSFNYAKPWNFGPESKKHYSVIQVLEMMSREWERPNLNYMKNPLPESNELALDSSKARKILGWNTPWDTHRVVSETISWYKDYYNSTESTRDLTLRQIEQWRKEIK